MSKDNKEDISLDYAFISLISPKIRVIIIGGGNGGYIKAKSFLQKGCTVYVLSKEFDEKFKNIDDIIFIKKEYHFDYLKDKHIVIISTDDQELNDKIKNDCESLSKIYLMSSSFQDGLFITPSGTQTKNISFSLHTKVGSPKTSVFLSKKIQQDLEQYDEFVEYVGKVRRKIKNRKLKLEIMEFLNSDDFYFFYKLNKHDLIVKLFWGELF